MRIGCSVLLYAEQAPSPTEKLHVMLSSVEHDGNSHIVSWQAHGRCFVVHKPKEFVSTVMPKYFRQTKLTSFQRQLNLYGFCRLTSGRDRGGYYHELFLRGRPFLCKRMMRTRIKGTGIKAASSPQTEVRSDCERLQMSYRWNRMLTTFTAGFLFDASCEGLFSKLSLT